MRFELTTPTLARLCSTTELRPLKDVWTDPFKLRSLSRRGIWQKLRKGASVCLRFYDILLPAPLVLTISYLN